MREKLTELASDLDLAIESGAVERWNVAAAVEALRDALRQLSFVAPMAEPPGPRFGSLEVAENGRVMSPSEVAAEYVALRHRARTFAELWAAWAINAEPMPGIELIESASELCDFLGVEIAWPDDELEGAGGAGDELEGAPS